MSSRRQLFRAGLAMLLGVTGLAAWPWSRDMVVQLFARPQQYSTVPPAGAIPTVWEAPLAREVAERALRNPLAATEANLASGKFFYETYCLVCHDARGTGKGIIAGGALLPADLTGERVRAQSDGALYHTIRNGFGTMPPYGPRLAPQERWQVILYVRTLQR